MKRYLVALMYTAFALLANPALADVTTAEALRAGDMKKLNFHSAPKEVSDAGFVTFDDAPLTLQDFEGKFVMVNFWATWCAPCRKEMPALSELQSELGGDNFEVVTIATGRNPKPAMVKFFDQIGVDNLPLHRDPKQALARNMAVLGLPITIIMNPQGQEIARLRGDADWASDNAKAVINALIGGAES